MSSQVEEAVIQILPADWTPSLQFFVDVVDLLSTVVHLLLALMYQVLRTMPGRSPLLLRNQRGEALDSTARYLENISGLYRLGKATPRAWRTSQATHLADHIAVSNDEKAAIATIRQQSVTVFDQYYVLPHLRNQAELAQRACERLHEACQAAQAEPTAQNLQLQPPVEPVQASGEDRTQPDVSQPNLIAQRDILRMLASLQAGRGLATSSRPAKAPKDMSHLSARIENAIAVSGLGGGVGTWLKLKVALSQEPKVSERQYRNWRKYTAWRSEV
jgi:hypothetical protein